jgi:hypothetical protein
MLTVPVATGAVNAAVPLLFTDGTVQVSALDPTDPTAYSLLSVSAEQVV